MQYSLAKLLSVTGFLFGTALLAGCTTPSEQTKTPAPSNKSAPSTSAGATVTSPVARADSTEGWQLTSNREIVRDYLNKSGMSDQIEIAYGAHLQTLTAFLQNVVTEENVDLDIDSMVNFVRPNEVLARVEKYMSHFVYQTHLSDEIEFLDTPEGIAIREEAKHEFRRMQTELQSTIGSGDLRRLISPKRNLVLPTKKASPGYSTQFQYQNSKAMVYVSDTLGNELYRMNQTLKQNLP